MLVANDIFFDLISAEIKQEKEVVITVKGKSMLPFLKDGQRIALMPINSKGIKVGDIVLAKWNNQYILHRVISLNASMVSLAGDNNLSLIERTEISNVIGKLKGSFNAKNRFITFKGFDRFLGLLWYFTRIPRIIINKIKT